MGEAKKNNKTPSLQGKWDKNTTMVLDHLYVTVPIVFPYYALKTRKMHRHDDLVSKSDSGHSDDDDDEDDDDDDDDYFMLRTDRGANGGTEDGRKDKATYRAPKPHLIKHPYNHKLSSSSSFNNMIIVILTTKRYISLSYCFFIFRQTANKTRQPTKRDRNTF